ncbi:FtsX-like permease family protein [Krasilnikovia sp. MM14-A1259]|uniref:FtsX-like permease family protein n=1 Tax=Krasilnikovia sp. MM14-A1259 TaxID=3373539 RepID=UPI003818B907
MITGLVRQALRRHPWSFVGPAATQCLAAAIVTGALGIAHSLDNAPRHGPDRQTMADSGLTDVAALFVTISVYLSVIIVGVTMGAAIARQARDTALARAIGATPGQVRRAIAVQSGVVALPATAVGVPLGMLGGHAWVDGLAGHGIVAVPVPFTPHPAAPAAALAVTVGTSLLGALVAAIRPARVRPSVALAETATPRRRVGVVRTVLGAALVAGGVALAVVISGLDATTADTAGLFVMLAMCVGAGLLGPALLRTAAPAGRLFGDVGRLAADNLAARARTYSGALVPLTLAVAFATVTVARASTAAHVTGVPEPAAERWMEYSGTGVYTAFAAVAALATLVATTLSRRRDLAVLRLTGGTRVRVLRVVVCEALLVTGTALLVAAAVAATALLPLLHTALGTWLPWLPAGQWAAGVLALTALVLAGTVPPALAVLRHPPVDAVR